jgi:hypothetical protein
LLPAARRECLDILRAASREAVGENAENLPAFIADLCEIQDYKALELEMEKWHQSGDLSPITETEILNLALGSLDIRGVLDRVIEVDLLYGPIEEVYARRLGPVCKLHRQADSIVYPRACLINTHSW